MDYNHAMVETLRTLHQPGGIPLGYAYAQDGTKGRNHFAWIPGFRRDAGANEDGPVAQIVQSLGTAVPGVAVNPDTLGIDLDDGWPQPKPMKSTPALLKRIRDGRTSPRIARLNKCHITRGIIKGRPELSLSIGAFTGFRPSSGLPKVPIEAGSTRFLSSFGSGAE
ncbi:hypothetical protein BS47DRAFT_1379985 [Hydnum rufescens UP504]|uniref:Uncharacterized protein n=1 Tax=Hydnum rufescens UP504 TaxID=1448309 RepID=A0A9P6DYA9_9AGAM|nr:hypothetical protein BS47DRAFT_1379985 [Hydnum rufescens UP504]